MTGSHGGGMGWVGMLLMGLFWVVLIGVVLYLVMRLLPSSGSGTTPGGAAPRESPEDILDRRFAAGEIDVQTYQGQRAALASAQGKK